MSRQQKALERLLSKPTDFTWPELLSIMTSFNVPVESGSGSGRRFLSQVKGKPFHIHQPHPSNILKRYQVLGAIQFLKDEGFLP